MKFDFTKYKSIVDFIRVSSIGVSVSLQELIDNTIFARQNATCNLVRHSTDIESIQIGILNTVPTSRIVEAPAGIYIENAIGELIINEHATVSDFSLFPKKITTSQIEYLAEDFIKKDETSPQIELMYSQDLSFEDDDIVDIKYYEDNFLTKKAPFITRKVISHSDSSDMNSGVSLEMAKKMSAINLDKKTLSASSEVLISNVVSVANDNISITNDIPLVVASNVNATSCSISTSLVTPTNIGSVCLFKDGSNWMPIRIGTTDSDDTVCTEDLLEQIASTAQSFLSSNITIAQTSSAITNTQLFSSDMLNLLGVPTNLLEVSEISKGLHDEVDVTISNLPVALKRVLGVYTEDNQLKIENAEAHDFALTFSDVVNIGSVLLYLKNNQLFHKEDLFTKVTQNHSLYISETQKVFSNRPMIINTESAIGTVENLLDVVKMQTSIVEIVEWE